jgi:hypothetical protein
VQTGANSALNNADIVSMGEPPKDAGLSSDERVSLEGPVEKIDGKLTLIIPLAAGGDRLIKCSRGISDVQGEYLKIVIQEWLAGLLRIEEGDLVVIDNEGGKFNIRPVNARPIH